MPRFHDGLVTGDSRFSLVKQRSYPGLAETLRDAYATPARLAAGAEAKAVRTGPDLGVRIRAGAHGPARHARRGPFAPRGLVFRRAIRFHSQPVSSRGQNHASVALLPANPAREPEGGGNRLASAHAARRHATPGGGRHV